jgi:hypothetical protein
MSRIGREIVVFYSWQSDLPDKTNRKAIRKSLREACSSVEKDFSNIHFHLDEATRGVSGSPNIPVTILEKIETADILVADVSIINTSSNSERKCPNPNVIFELGFGVAHLGWNRIIMLFNSAHGDVSDLPFDFDRQRVSHFSLPIAASTVDRQQLSSLLSMALRAVVVGNPKRPSELKARAPTEQKRERDVSNLRWLFSTIHLPTLDAHVREVPYKVRSRTLYFWEGFNAVMTSSLFHLYDRRLHRKLRDLHESWDASTSYGKHYHSAAGGDVTVFSNPGDRPLDEEQEKAWHAISEAARKMERALAKVTKIVREEYLEIDLTETNKTAWREYVENGKEDAFDVKRGRASVVPKRRSRGK